VLWYVASAICFNTTKQLQVLQKFCILPRCLPLTGLSSCSSAQHENLIVSDIRADALVHADPGTIERVVGIRSLFSVPFEGLSIPADCLYLGGSPHTCVSQLAGLNLLVPLLTSHPKPIPPTQLLDTLVLASIFTGGFVTLNIALGLLHVSLVSSLRCSTRTLGPQTCQNCPHAMHCTEEQGPICADLDLGVGIRPVHQTQHEAPLRLQTQDEAPDSQPQTQGVRAGDDTALGLLHKPPCTSTCMAAGVGAWLRRYRCMSKSCFFVSP
jgi:hypothetical protein